MYVLKQIFEIIYICKKHGFITLLTLLILFINLPSGV